MALFGKKKADGSDVSAHVKTVSEVLAKIGVNSQPKLLDGNKGYGWMVQRGSAVVYILINVVDGQGYLKVVSPILYLPQENLLPLYRTLLEINMELTSAALGIQEDKICVITERSVNGLDPVEADELIKRVAFYADSLDNKLSSEFGARLVNEST